MYRSALAPTPMLTGVFRPAIWLPDEEYSAERLRCVLLHELAQLRRRDVWIKWLAAFAVNLHWYNPLVWLMRREIDRACELACDEAVIGLLDANGRQRYGDTLIAVAAQRKMQRAVISTTMCEQKKTLKERLGAIMRYKKKSAAATALSFALIALLAAGVFAAGARPGGDAAGKWYRTMFSWAAAQTHFKNFY